MRVLFRLDSEPNLSFVGQLLRGDVPTVLCGHCGRGIALPIVNQDCSAGCGAYVYEVMTEVSGGPVRRGLSCARGAIAGLPSI